MSSIKLYDEDAYLKEFEAKVISSEPVSDSENEWWVELDRTAFFPEAGGQTPDRGVIAGVEVTDVQISDGVIRHRVGEDFKAGDRVSCSIDWSHRFSNMQQHTGEHIFSGIVHDLFGYDNVGFHLSDHIVTMDYSGPLTKEDVDRIEMLSNQAIWEAKPVYAGYPSDEELEKTDYRSKGELQPPIRIVTIEGVDICACCAPHVKNTAEVGILKVIGFEKYKAGTRLSILCGKRALEDYRDKQETILCASRVLSVKTNELTDEASRLLEEKGKLEYRIRKFQEESLKEQAEQIPADTLNAWIFTGDADPNVIRNTINKLASVHKGYSGIFYGCDDESEEALKFIIASGKDGSGKPASDAREAINILKASFEVKGGGSAEMVQGSVKASVIKIRQVLDSL